MDIRQIHWGDESAEKDSHLLSYFVKSEALNRLTEKRKNVIVGRKGAGKSALLKKLNQTFSENNIHTINITPNENSIRSILNDTDIINNFGAEIFFQYVWLKYIYHEIIMFFGALPTGEKLSARSRNFFLQQGGPRDIIETVGNILTRIKIKAGKLGDLGIDLEKEILNASEINIIEGIIKEVYDNHSLEIIVLVDDLDLGWDNSKTSNDMLLGLLSASSKIQSKFKSIFPIISLREDIYSILMSKTQHADKLRNIEKIRWTKDNLINVLDERIKYNLHPEELEEEVESQHFFHLVFPQTIGTSNTDNWLIERTLSRPRELIQFARIYTELVEGDRPDAEKLKEAEYLYSKMKLDDVCSEFSHQYPDLDKVMEYWSSRLRRKKYHLKYDEIGEMIFEIFDQCNCNSEWFLNLKKNADIDGFLKILYEVGIVGDFILGGAGGSRTVYEYETIRSPNFEEIQIHPCFRIALDTVQRIRSTSSSVNQTAQ
ncbi:hypothetical protein HKD24_14715 [Gluconobacter sp. LMG 31484]|uniref:Uncharacterized protein n=1 Tax=Gluconobacter vitians TaxID=2728102 RepID=A0ABR9Y9R8_9PROT|nr:hypothetical protein [Gluconobacter vitians]MBF0860426.1 hypothetical protein [Gluconobacter vitians]